MSEQDFPRQQERADQQAVMESPLKENKATTRQAFIEEVCNQGNLAIIDELWSPNFVHHTATGLVHGPEGFKQFATMWRTAFPDLHITVEDMIAEADQVVTRWTGRGTHLGPLLGILPTGKRATMTGILIVRFEGGKFVEGWIEFDAAGMMQQLGEVRTVDTEPLV